MKTQIEGTIRGQVQGVDFRASTRQFAHSHGINGIVRNEPDGSVYIEAEGTEDQLNVLRESLEHETASSDANSIDLHEGELRNYEGFSVQG